MPPPFLQSDFVGRSVREVESCLISPRTKALCYTNTEAFLPTSYVHPLSRVTRDVGTNHVPGVLLHSQHFHLEVPIKIVSSSSRTRWPHIWILRTAFPRSVSFDRIESIIWQSAGLFARHSCVMRGRHDSRHAVFPHMATESCQIWFTA